MFSRVHSLSKADILKHIDYGLMASEAEKRSLSEAHTAPNDRHNCKRKLSPVSINS